jgi:hypothetical protein
MVVIRKETYGTIRFYPINDTAQKFADLMGRMTFDVGHLKRIKDIGVDVQVTYEEVAI